MSDILLVEDDEELRTLLRIVMTRAGYQVREACNGREALAIQNSNPADLVITDVIMPDKEGIETIIELRRTYPDIKIIAMSGGGRVGAQGYLKIAVKSGADYILAKPFSNQEILNGVHLMLQGNSDLGLVNEGAFV